MTNTVNWASWAPESEIFNFMFVQQEEVETSIFIFSQWFLRWQSRLLHLFYTFLIYSDSIYQTIESYFFIKTSAFEWIISD